MIKAGLEVLGMLILAGVVMPPLLLLLQDYVDWLMKVL